MRVAGADVDVLARLDRLADAQPKRRQDVALLAVGVMQKRDPGRAVGVVLDRVHAGRNPVLAALEVDDPVAALVPAAAVAGRDAAVDVSPGLLRERCEQRLLGLGLRDLLEVGHRHEAAAGRGGLEFADGHCLRLPVRMLRWSARGRPSRRPSSSPGGRRASSRGASASPAPWRRSRR